MITREEFAQYMIDVKGWSLPEANESWYFSQGQVQRILEASDIRELISYNA